MQESRQCRVWSWPAKKLRPSSRISPCSVPVAEWAADAPRWPRDLAQKFGPEVWPRDLALRFCVAGYPVAGRRGFPMPCIGPKTMK
ncbi:MAG: hypothetical protein OXU61_09390 [Gammaproteobacteria bacterium]|nr:hypothetical protein [Gammaproteobacteria bacterium]